VFGVGDERNLRGVSITLMYPNPPIHTTQQITIVIRTTVRTYAQIPPQTSPKMGENAQNITSWYYIDFPHFFPFIYLFILDSEV
jgi:hypothetical protein